jgi:hypothetical protein
MEGAIFGGGIHFMGDRQAATHEMTDDPLK